MKSKNFIKYPRKPGKYEMEKGSQKELEQRALLKVVESLSRRKTPAYIYIRGAGPCNTTYENLQEVLWIKAKKIGGGLDSIIVFDGIKDRKLSLWNFGDARIKEIKTIKMKDVKNKAAGLDTKYKNMMKEMQALVDYIEKNDFDGKDFKGKNRQEILSMLKRAYANVYGSCGSAEKIRNFGRKNGRVLI